MKVAISTPGGNIGSKVTDCLLSAGVNVVLLSHDINKVRQFVKRGAEVKQGSVENPRYLIDATYGVDGLFWVTPPSYNATDLRGFQVTCGQSAAEAIRVNRIGHVVNLSSVGAQHSGGCGPINGLHDVEGLLDSVSDNIVHLRPGWFFENFLFQLDSIRRDSCIYMPLDGSTRYPMIATKDIANAACGLLRSCTFTGRGILGLHGPVNLSLYEAADLLSRGLGRNIRYVKVGEEIARNSLRLAGMSASAVDAMMEMYRGVESGHLTPSEPRTIDTTTPTTLDQFASEVIAPLLLKPVPVAS